MTLLLQSLPRALHIDEWIFHNNVLSFSPGRRFRPKKVVFQPLSESPGRLWIAYLIANKHGMTCSSNHQEQRLTQHNMDTHKKQPAVMACLPKHWQLFAWVGPFQTRQQAESFESLWKAQGKGRHIRNLMSHILAAYQVLGRHNYSEAKVHYQYMP